MVDMDEREVHIRAIVGAAMLNTPSDALLETLVGHLLRWDSDRRTPPAEPVGSGVQGEAWAVEGVVFVLVRDGKVLMERCPKKAARHGGEWFIPGGRVEDGELVTAALRREMREELGVAPDNPQALPLVDAAGGEQYGPFLMRPFLITKWRGDVPSHCLDHPDVPLRWVPIDEALRSPVRAVRSILTQLPLRTATAETREPETP